MQPFQVYQAEIDPSLSSDLEVSYIGLVDRPAIEKNFQAFKENEKKLRFSLDEERHIISGPAMIAEMLLYRNDPQMGEYYVYFSKETIYTIVEKFSAKGLMQKFNLFHDPNQQVDGVVMFNSFIIDRTLGINPPVGFEDLPDGSWFISNKVNNPQVWDKVKSGEVKGFSVEGIFEYLPAKTVKLSEDEQEKQLVQMLVDMNIIPAELLTETSV